MVCFDFHWNIKYSLYIGFWIGKSERNWMQYIQIEDFGFKISGFDLLLLLRHPFVVVRRNPDRLAPEILSLSIVTAIQSNLEPHSLTALTRTELLINFCIENRLEKLNLKFIQNLELIRWYVSWIISQILAFTVRSNDSKWRMHPTIW